jgi:hypothetical protein
MPLPRLACGGGCGSWKLRAAGVAAGDPGEVGGRANTVLHIPQISAPSAFTSPQLGHRMPLQASSGEGNAL